MPLDYEGTTNEFKPNLVSPELQSIIDKVTSSSSMSSRQRSDVAGLAGVVGGLQRNRETEGGLAARLGITGTQKMAETKLSDTGATERANIVTTPGIMQQKRANQTIGVGGIGTPPPAPPSEPDKNWWELNKDSMFNF
jgi:hypothetical protein